MGEREVTERGCVRRITRSNVSVSRVCESPSIRENQPTLSTEFRNRKAPLQQCSNAPTILSATQSLTTVR